ncbi:hypothetical protein ABPG72_003989 [Tetrahymena utriculariae]
MQENFQITTLGGGCFWCIEAIFRIIKGVFDVRSGYPGGNIANPTFKQISSRTTQHAEVIQFKYNLTIISYDNILKIFMSIHKQFTKNPNQSTQYRSIILYSNEEHKQIAPQIIAEVNESKIYPQSVETEVVPLNSFYEAEENTRIFTKQTRAIAIAKQQQIQNSKISHENFIKINTFDSKKNHVFTAILQQQKIITNVEIVQIISRDFSNKKQSKPNENKTQKQLNGIILFAPFINKAQLMNICIINCKTAKIMQNPIYFSWRSQFVEYAYTTLIIEQHIKTLEHKQNINYYLETDPFKCLFRWQFIAYDIAPPKPIIYPTKYFKSKGYFCQISDVINGGLSKNTIDMKLIIVYKIFTKKIFSSKKKYPKIFDQIGDVRKIMLDSAKFIIQLDVKKQIFENALNTDLRIKYLNAFLSQHYAFSPDIPINLLVIKISIIDRKYTYSQAGISLQNLTIKELKATNKLLTIAYIQGIQLGYFNSKLSNIQLVLLQIILKTIV